MSSSTSPITTSRSRPGIGTGRHGTAWHGTARHGACFFFFVEQPEATKAPFLSQSLTELAKESKNVISPLFPLLPPPPHATHLTHPAARPPCTFIGSLTRELEEVQAEKVSMEYLLREKLECSKCA